MNALHAFVLFFILSNIIASGASARVIDRTAAVVNSSVILISDMAEFQKQAKLRSQLDPFISFFQIQPETEKDVLNYLVQEQLILEKFPAKEDEVEEAINNVQRNNGINREQLKQVLASEGVAFDIYKEMMKTSVAKGRLVEQLRHLAVVSDEQVKNLYYTSPEFKELRKGQKTVLSYDLEHLVLPNKATADIAHSRLTAGEDLDSVLALLTDRGVEKVDHGVLSEESLNATIRKALESTGPGGFSLPISTGSGYIILHVKSVGAPKDPAFERVKEQIRNRLFKSAFRNQLVAWTARERSGSFVHIP